MSDYVVDGPMADMDSRGMYRWAPGDSIGISVAQELMQGGVWLQTAHQRLGWESDTERWVLRRVRGNKILGAYRHFAVAFLMLVGRE